MHRIDSILRRVRALGVLSAAGVLFLPVNGMALEEVVDKVRPALVRVIVTDGQDRPISSGAGFFISSDGDVVTNAHFIRSDAKVLVETESGAMFQVEKISAADVPHNIAILKVRGRRLPKLDLVQPGELRDGMPLLVVPFALSEEASPIRGQLQLSSGDGEAGSKIPIGAELSASVVGAPVCDISGKVLGLATLTLTGNERKSFVIPAAHIHALMANPQAPVALNATPAAGSASASQNAATDKKSVSSKEFAVHSVIIQGDNSSGSGFIAAYEGQPHLFTNNHVISGNTRLTALLLDGTPLKLSRLLVDGEYDLAVFAQEGGSKGLEILENVDQNVEVGDEVLVVGNSMGSRVVTDLRGTVQGIGPGLVEVDAPFVSGNSGSPVIHVKTGKVIGIATYVEIKSLEGYGKDSKFNQAERRFAYRLDNPSKMEAIDWSRFTRETSALAQMRERTDQVWDLIKDIQTNGKVTNWNSYIRESSHLSMTIGAWQKDLAQAKSGGILIAKRRLISGIIMTLQADTALLNPKLAHAYARKQYDQILKERKVLIGYFRSLEEQLSNDPHFISR